MSNLERYTGTRPASSLPEKVQYAQQLAAADLLPANYRKKPGNVLLACEYGEMLDIHPLTAIQQVHVIEGKLSMSAELMRAQVARHGHTFRTVEMSSERARVSITRGDDPEHTTTVEFSIEDAKRANLTGKGVWKQYPAAMLHARATSMAVRAVCPEVLMGISYTPEELGAAVGEDGEVIDVRSEPIVLATQAQMDRIAELSRGLDDEGRAVMTAWKAERGIDWHQVSAADAAEAILELERRVPTGPPDGDGDGPGGDGGGEPADPPTADDDGAVEAVIVDTGPGVTIDAAEPAAPESTVAPEPEPDPVPAEATRTARPLNERGQPTATRAELLDLMNRAGKGPAKVMLVARNICAEQGLTLPAEFDGVTDGLLVDALVWWLRETCLGEDPLTTPAPEPAGAGSEDHRRLARRMHATAADTWGRGKANEETREAGRRAVILAVTGDRTASSNDCTIDELDAVCDLITDIGRGAAVIENGRPVYIDPVAS